MPPKLIGPYRVLETLGSGGVATVYRAVDRRTNEAIALKLLSNGPALDPDAARRLAREFETLSDLSHPHVVKVFDSGVFEGYPYLAMELVEGLTLRHYLTVRDTPDIEGLYVRPPGLPPPKRRAAPEPEEPSITGTGRGSGELPFDLSAFSEEPPSDEGGPGSLRAFADAADEPYTLDSGSFELPYALPTRQAPETAPAIPEAVLNRPERLVRLRESMMQLCEALAYIHAHGLVHRDVKPSNIMVDEEHQVRLMDFGLAKFLADDSQQVTKTGKRVGTFRYMSPEQILGEPLDGRADLYSLGVVLYEMLSGRPPFDARNPHELWQKVLETEAPPIHALNGDSDPQLARVAHRLMRKEPDDRFQTAEEVLEALSE